MRTDEFITSLRKNNNIFVSVVNNELKVKAGSAQLTPSIVEAIKARKAEILDFFSGIADGARAYALPKEPAKASYCLSSAQKRMYFLYQLNKDTVAYNMPQFMSLEGKLDTERLERAINELVSRHESLRTVFRLEKGEPVQIIRPYTIFSMEHICTDDPGPVLQAFVKPFNLENDSLFRAAVISTSKETHILAVDMHHIITDGVSNGLLIRDFMMLYNEAVLPELSLQYTDYAEWQQSDQQKQSLTDQKQYWLQAFSSEPEQLNLPLDFVRPAAKQFEGDSISCRISGETLTSLHLLLEQEAATMYMVLLSGFSVLMGKLGNTTDVVIGTPAAGRGHADLENIIGMFANTLPLRSFPEGSKTFAQYLSEVKQVSLAGFENQAYQYEELIGNLNIERDGRRNPLFDVMFAYDNFDDNLLSVPGLTIAPLNTRKTVAKFDLTLSVVNRKEYLELTFDYDISLFSRKTVERFASYFSRIIDAVVANKHILLNKISLLSNEEINEQLVSFNKTTALYRKNETLVDLFEEQVEETPDNIAVICNEREVTYRQLDEMANQVARHLQKCGVPQGALVALLAERSIEMMTGILGILKAGCAYLPLNITHPSDKHREILKESGTTFLMTGRQHAAAYERDICIIDINDPKIDTYDTYGPWVVKQSTDTAYVIYTSGSTGRPNGVMISHRSVINLVNAQQKAFNINDDEVILQFATISFDASVEQIWLALLNGAKLLVIDAATISDSSKFCRYIAEKKVTHLHATPSFLESIDLLFTNSLKRIIAGGEACRPQLANKFLGRYTFINEYGPTETTVTSIQYIVDRNDTSINSVAIGRPIDNTQAYILGPHLELLPRGVTGELYIGGDGLAQGYLHNDLLTSARFVPNPYKKDERFYKTGDLALWLDDGNIVFLGRNDEQIKIRGFRIEPGEVETRLACYEGIENVVVFAKEVHSELCLVAYYIAGNEISQASLRQFLAEKLPDYMIPSYFVRIDSIPQNHNGKINKKLLPDPEHAVHDNYVPPSDDVEEQLVEIWASLLNLQHGVISTNKSFFELGGHSLKALTMVNKISVQFDVEISLKEIFQLNTILDIANYIRNEIWVKAKIDNSLQEEFILE